MKHLVLVALFGLFSLSCTNNETTGSKELSSRKPQGLKSAFQSVKRLTVGTFENALKHSTEFVTEEAVEKIGRIYIRKLPLSSEVEDSMIEMLENDNHVKRMIPFLKFMQDNYSFDKGHEFHDFKSHALRNRKLLEVPGSSHKLFDWAVEAEDKAAEEKKSMFNQTMIAKIVEVYHLIFAEYRPGSFDPKVVFEPYKLMTKEKLDLEVLASVKPVLASILKEVLTGASESAEGATKEAVEGFLAMIKGYEIPDDDPAAKLPEVIEAKDRFEALTISLIDFVASIAHKSFRIYLSNYVIRSAVKSHVYSFVHKMREGDYNEGDPMQNLMDYADFERNGKNYAMQIGVDGLQKTLTKSLANIEKPNKYIKTLLSDHKVLEKKALLGGKGKSPEEVQDHAFLEFAISKPGYKNEHYLPFFKWLFKEGNGQGIARRGISTTPTISVRNLPIIFTGAKPTGDHGTGVPNFHFVDRDKDRAYYFFGNDALQLDTLTTDAGMITQFKRFQDLGVQTLNCNAQYDWGANDTLDGLVNLGLGEASRDFGEKLCFFKLMKRAKNEKKLRSAWKNLKELAREYKGYGKLLRATWGPIKRKQIRNTLKKEILPILSEGMPEYVLWYNPWPDHFAHFYGPFSDEITGTTGELNRLDYWIGKMYEAYELAGVKDRTLFGMAGDHGLAPIYKYINPEVTVIEAFAKETGRKVKVLKISSDEGEGPKLNNALSPKTSKGYDIIIASTAGGNYMLDLFLGQDDKKWKQQPTFSQLKSMPLISGGAPVNWIKELKIKLKDSLDYMVTRSKTCPRNEKYKECTEKKQFVVVSGIRNKKFYNEKIYRIGDKFYYKPSPGDLLGLKNLKPRFNNDIVGNESTYNALYEKCVKRQALFASAKWCGSLEWDLLTSYTDRPGSVVQLGHLYDTDLAGTINLFPKYGVGYNTKVPGRHAGESFHEKDAFTGLWGDPIKGFSGKIETAINGSVAPSIYEWISGDPVVADGKRRFGFGYDPIIPFTEK